LVLIALILMLWLAVQTTTVQNWLVGKVTRKLSSDLNTTVQIGQVDFSLFDKMHLVQTLIKDQRNDTLLYAGDLSVSLTDWFFFKDKIVLKYVGLKDARIRLSRTDSIWNYAFLIDYFGGGEKKTSAKQIQLGLEKMELTNVEFIQKDGWRGEDQTISVGSLSLTADLFDIVSKKIHIKSISLDKPLFALHNYPGNRPKRVWPKSEKIKNDPAHLRWNTEGWNIEIDALTLEEGIFRTTKKDRLPTDNYFDGNNILFSDINGTFKKLKFLQDSITATGVLSTRERSGFTVTKLSSNIRFHPEAMEFTELDLQTPSSQLQNSFIMRYDSFDDLGDFITTVQMEGKFNNASISSDDIAYFQS
jgi:uncharacterized protein involved in outer membrane biogenesis